MIEPTSLGEQRIVIDVEPFDWKTEGKRLIRAVDPAYTDPVYFLTPSEAGRELDRGTVALHWTFASLDLRPRLEQLGMWQGRHGFCAIVNAESAPSLERLRGVILHEYVHDCETRNGRNRMAKLATEHELTLDQLLEGRPEAKSEDLPRPWLDHGTPFIRLSIHAGFRARAAGIPVEDYRIFNSLYYLLADVQYYRTALSDEPERFAGLPLAEVLAITPPESFIKYAAEDVAFAEERWRYRQPGDPAIAARAGRLLASGAPLEALRADKAGSELAGCAPQDTHEVACSPSIPAAPQLSERRIKGHA